MSFYTYIQRIYHWIIKLFNLIKSPWNQRTFASQLLLFRQLALGRQGRTGGLARRRSGMTRPEKQPTIIGMQWYICLHIYIYIFTYICIYIHIYIHITMCMYIYIPFKNRIRHSWVLIWNQRMLVKQWDPASRICTIWSGLLLLYPLWSWWCNDWCVYVWVRRVFLAPRILSLGSVIIIGLFGRETRSARISIYIYTYNMKVS